MTWLSTVTWLVVTWLYLLFAPGAACVSNTRLLTTQTSFKEPNMIHKNGGNMWVFGFICGF